MRYWQRQWVGPPLLRIGMGVLFLGLPSGAPAQDHSEPRSPGMGQMKAMMGEHGPRTCKQSMDRSTSTRELREP